ncbi:hypothetical protein ES703_13036 [subsurface metagenome]
MKKTLLLFLMIACFILTGFRDSSDPKIRVAILLDASSVKISATGRFKIFAPGKLEAVVTGDEDSIYQIQPGLFGLKMDGPEEYGDILEIKPLENTFIRVNNRTYRGEIEVRKTNDALLVINEVDLEEYLYGVMKHEISPAWPLEAVKAQAVAARSFALNKKLKNIGKPYDLCATITSQVYGGLSGEDPRSNEAIDETRGEILTYEGRPIAAYYHATCGGETEDVENVWGGRLPYLKGVRCRYCKDSPHYEWEEKLSLLEISNALGHKGISEVESIEIYKRSDTGRIVKLVVEDEFGKHIISGNQFRMALGPNLIRSTLFKIKEKRGRVEFKGKGWGHGVGMCQWGTKGMAERDFSYKEILKHYYSNAEIRKMDNR